MPYDELGRWKDCECLRFDPEISCKCPCHNPMTRTHNGKYLSDEKAFEKGYDQAITEIVEEIQTYWPNVAENESWPKLKNHLRGKFRFLKPE